MILSKSALLNCTAIILITLFLSQPLFSSDSDRGDMAVAGAIAGAGVGSVAGGYIGGVAGAPFAGIGALPGAAVGAGAGAAIFAAIGGAAGYWMGVNLYDRRNDHR